MFEFYGIRPNEVVSIENKAIAYRDALLSLDIEKNMTMTMPKGGDDSVRCLKDLRDLIKAVCASVGIPSQYVAYELAAYPALYFIEIIPKDKNVYNVEKYYDLCLVSKKEEPCKNTELNRLKAVFDTFLEFSEDQEKMKKYVSGDSKIVGSGFVPWCAIQRKLHKSAIFKHSDANTLKNVVLELEKSGHIELLNPMSIRVRYETRQKIYRVLKKTY